MGYQGGCHGLPDRGRLARYLPPSRRRSRRRRSARAGGGGSARVRDAARGSVRGPPRRRSQRAAEGAAAGAPPPVGWGQSYKEDPEVETSVHQGKLVNCVFYRVLRLPRDAGLNVFRIQMALQEEVKAAVREQKRVL
ncbi:sorting nexin-10 [Prionailurus iriomotensis]